MKRKPLLLYILSCFITFSINGQSSQPTKEELTALKKLEKIYRITPFNASDVQLEKARDYVKSCGISSENKITDGISPDTKGKVDKKLLLDISATLGALSSSSLESDKELCRTFIDYILSQGVTGQIDFTLPTNDYSTVRNLPKGFFISLQVATDRQKDEILKFLAQILEFRNVYLPDGEYLSQINADVLTNVVTHYYSYAISRPDKETAIKDLKAITRYLNRTTEYVPGEKDMLKPDGTGFHHKTHYNNYMYSCDSWIKAAYHLKGTPLRVDIEAFRRMRKAVIAMYVMATRDRKDIRYTANSLSGRNPYGKNGVKVQVPRESFRKLIEIGGDLQNKAFDEELAAVYNFFFMTNEYKVETKSYNGFFQFNYSPIGVYRNENWVATMRSPTTKLWGAEIYNTTNRFGRYQSHGSLEVMYDGSLAESGCPVDDMSGGWDWNVVPGTTTVHYTSWAEMMPSGNTSQRFDQYTKTKNFSGALAWGQTGLFAADFDQIDTWGKQTFEPTNLVFKKSVFAIDNMLFCMGSNIGASGEYEDGMITATNLFQGIKYPESGELILDGNIIDDGYCSVLEADKTRWIITPQSTGYIIPEGNDRLELIYDKQTSPKQTGADTENPETTVTAAKAFLNHGAKTKDKSYFYIVIPNANSDNIIELSNAIEKGGSNNNIYEILRRDSILHAFSYKPENITAYSVFEPSQNINTGILKASATQLLLIVKNKGESQISVAVCNPNLNPVVDNEFGWRSVPTYASIVFEGKWKNTGNNNIKEEIIGGDTRISFTLQEGEPLYFDLNK